MTATENTDLNPAYLFKNESAKYLRTTERKISLYIRYGLLRYAKYGKNYVIRKDWLDEFAEQWSGYDLSNEDKIKLAINARKWKVKHSV